MEQATPLGTRSVPAGSFAAFDSVWGDRAGGRRTRIARFAEIGKVIGEQTADSAAVSRADSYPRRIRLVPLQLPLLETLGFDGMVFRAGETYDFSIWTRAHGKALPVQSRTDWR